MQVLHKVLDKTILNLTTILISGTGIIAALIKYSAPQLNASFLGENPFAVKRDIIESILVRVFVGLTMVGLLIQLALLIWGTEIPERRYTTSTYVVVLGSGVVLMFVLVWGLTWIAQFFARKRWLPEIISRQRQLYDEVKFIILHDGWRKDQLEKGQLNDPDRDQYRDVNFRTVDRRLDQLEALLEIKPREGSRYERLERLRSFFETKE